MSKYGWKFCKIQHVCRLSAIIVNSRRCMTVCYCPSISLHLSKCLVASVFVNLSNFVSNLTPVSALRLFLWL